MSLISIFLIIISARMSKAGRCVHINENVEDGIVSTVNATEMNSKDFEKQNRVMKERGYKGSVYMLENNTKYEYMHSSRKWSWRYGGVFTIHTSL